MNTLTGETVKLHRKTDSPKVLCVDDDPDLTIAIGTRLRQYGLNPLRAFSGAQAFWTALKEQPDVIITDHRMPDGPGNYLIGRLQSHPLTKGIPVIVLTGQRGAGLERELKGLGASAFLTKPLMFEALILELERYVTFPRHPLC